MPHLHIGAAEFGVDFLMLLLGLFLIRTVETRWPDSSVGKALAFIH